MTKLFPRKPHPAKAARILATGMSATAFMSMISVFTLNAHNAAALAPVDATTPTNQTAVTPPITGTSNPTSATPAPTTKKVTASTGTSTKKIVSGTKPAATSVKSTPVVKAKTTVVKKTTVATPTRTTTPVVKSTPVVVTPTHAPVSQGSTGGSRKP